MEGQSFTRMAASHCLQKPLSAKPPSSITLWISAALLQPACSQPRGERPSSKLKILAPSCFPIESSAHKQNEAWRAAQQAEPQDQEGMQVPPAAEESTAAVLGMSGPTASGFQTPIRNNTSPPRPPSCKTQHKQYVHSLLLKEKIIFWVMSLPPSLKRGKDGEGSGLSPGLSTHLSSLLFIIKCNLYTTLLEKH